MFKERRLVKRIVSAFSAAILIAGNALSALPDNAFAEESVPAAHTVNVFDIDIKQGANYYESYDVSDTMAPDSDKAVSELDDVYVWQADNANEGHKFVFNIRLSLSGIGATDINTLTGVAREKTEEAVGAGFVKISVPRHILKFNGDDAIVPDSNNVYPDELEMPVTSWDTIYSQEASASTKPAERLYYKEDPVTKEKIYDPHVFVYYLDDNGTPDDESDDKYVIFNTQPISAGEVYEFPIAYITTKNTWEYKDLDPSVDCQAELEIASWKKDVDVESKTDADSIVLTSKTPKIPVYIDTAATLKSSSKKIEFNNGIVLMNKNQLPAAARSIVNSDDDDAYKYAIWSVSSEISDVTQRYQLSLSDEYSAELDLQGTDANGNEHKAKGEIVAVNMGSGYTADKDQQGNYTVSGLTEAGRRTDYVLVRYNRQPADGYDGTDAMDDIEVNAAPAVYQTKNTSVMTLTPEDRQDKPSEISSSAIYKYEKKKPEFHPVVEKYTAAKYGLYANGLRRVGSKSNVTSYELSKLTTERSEPVSGIMYETVTSAYAYGRTVDDLTTSLKSMSVTKTADGFVVSAANREYRFVSDSDEYTVSVVGGETVTHTVPAGYFEDGNISEDDAQRIAGKDVAENYYGQKALVYTLDDNDLTLIPDVMAPSQDNKALGSSDYAINSVSYEYGFKNFSYDEYDMQFKEGVKNRDPLGGTNDVLEFYAYVDGSDVPQLGGKYDVVGLKASEVDDSLVEMLDNNKIVFKDGSKVTGYQIKTTNKYYYIELTTKPSLTVYPSTAFKAAADVLMDPPEGQVNVSEKKIGVTNLAEFDIRNEDDGYINSFDIRGTDYIADIVKKSSISKKALGERTSYIGQDGNVYKSENDTLLGQYRLAWMTTMSELADGVEKPDGTIDNNVPVTQQSGVFYDLLPEHCDILEDSINVYCNAGTNINTSTASLPSSSFRLREKINNYNNSGRKLVVIEIDAPCTQSYTVTYCTIHSHDDIQDYGSTVLNTVAYQTGNPDIGDGFADDGGNYSVTMSKYIKGLDPDNGNAKRFIYAEATEDILALFPTSSGIYKKVATDSAPTFGKSGTVRNNEEYTYNIRMQNDSATRATDIAILDSIENYRTLDWESDPEKAQINKGIGKDRDWTGTLQRIDMMGLRDKVEKYLVSERTAYYYENPDEMNFGGGTDDDRRAAAAAKAQSIVDGSGNTEYALDNVLKVMVYIGGDTQYDEDGIIRYEDVVNLESTAYSDSDDRQYLLKAILDPSQMIDDEDHRALNETAKKWKTVAIDYETGKPTDGTDLAEASALIVYINDRFVLDKGDSVSFNVIMKAPDTVDSSSKLHYGDELDNGGTQPLVPHPTTYNNVYRSFRSSNTKNSQNKYTYFYTHYDYTQLSYTTVGDLSFSKVDSEEQTDRLEGVEFSLSGTSDYGTPYNITMTSDANGVVSFRNLERGRYTLIETQADADHITNTKPRIVEVDFRGRFMFVDVDGEEVQREFVYDRNGNQVFADNDPDFPLYSYTLTNERRYHGEFEFRKVNSLKGEDSEYSGAQGAVFTLEGTSDYGTTYGGEQDTEGRYTQTSGSDGTVSFGDIEAGTYTLTEIRPANGCMQPQYTKYTVKSTGSDEITFTIIPVDAGNDLLSTDKSGGYCISNTPMAELDLLKEDSVTLNPLGSAEFTLTAETGSAAARQIELTPEFYKSRGWQKTEEGWQITSEEKGPLGEYWIRYLPVGKDGKADFTLVESVAPVGHEPQRASYDVYVEPVENGEENFVITVSGCDYAQKTKSGDYSYENVTAENADFVRVLNDPSYKTKKTLIKSWVGGVPVSGNFPSLHLSSNEPDFVPKKVTINTAFKNSILTANNKRIFNGKFVQVGSSDGLTNCTATTAAEGKSDDEEGQIWFKFDNDVNSPTYGSVLYYTDANVIYLPIDCSNFFSGLSYSEFDELDLSGFDFSKVKNISCMFLNSAVIKSIKFPTIEELKVNKCNGVFQGCKALESLDLSWLDTSEVTDLSYMFYDCQVITEIITDPAKFTTSSELTTVDRFLARCGFLKGFGTRYDIDNGIINLSGFGECPKLTEMHNFIGGAWSNSTYVPNGTASDRKGQYYLINTIDLCHFKPSVNFVNNNKTEDIWIFHRIRPDNGVKIYSPDWEYQAGHNRNRVIYETIFNVNGEKISLSQNATADSFVVRTNENNGIFTDPTLSPNYSNPVGRSALAGRNAAGSVQLQAAGDGDEGTEVTFEDSYPPYFSKIGGVKVSNAKAGAEDGVTFGYQYDTPEDIAIPADDEASVEVTEVITLVVKKTVDGKVYTQNYEYNGPEVKAVWKKNAGSQWECEFNVLDNTAVMYAWESDYPGYTSEQTYEHTLETQNEDADTQDPNAVISNVKEGVDVGGLIVEKQITGLLNGADPDDEFEFVVMMKNGNENYDLKPFTNGVYEFKLKNGQKKTISSIPVGCTYTVYEKNPSASQSGMFSYVSGNVSVSTPIVKNTSPTVKITNKAERTSLTLSKTAQLNKYHLTDPATAITLDSSDPDKQAWESREFSFDVSFTGLIPGEVYSYTVNGESAAFIGDTTTVSGIKLKNADTVVFNDLPVTAQYTIVEDESFVNTVSDDLKDIYTVKIGDEVSDDQTAAGTLTSTAETVHFTNIRDLTKPETVSLTVSKEWYHEGRAVQWLEYEGAPPKFSRDTNGELYVDPDKGVYIPYVTLDNGDKKYLDLDISFPSFLNVYLGYGLYDPELNNNGELDVNDPDKNMLLLQGVDQRQTLNVKNGWSYTYKDLPKQGSIVTYETYTDDNGEEQVRKNVKYLNYVYYVTEIMPTGFKLKSEGTAVDSSLSYNANPYYTESETSFFDRDAYFDLNAYKYTGVSDTQSVALKNQTIPTRKLSVGKLATEISEAETRIMISRSILWTRTVRLCTIW